LRLYSDILASLDQWIAKQPEPKPKRTEAIRELLREALANK
jgi:metal-responsive CopG/Arc/MetJ family transcriptional regulator